MKLAFAFSATKARPNINSIPAMIKLSHFVELWPAKAVSEIIYIEYNLKKPMQMRRRSHNFTGSGQGLLASLGIELNL